MLSIMSSITAKSSATSYRLRYRLREVTFFFALAASPLAASFGVYANNQSRLPLSTFGVVGRSSSPLSSNSISVKATRLSTDSATSTEQAQDSGAMTSSKTSASKLELLRARMEELSLDCYLVPTDDPHLSEYAPAAYMRRKFLTGFGGSAGTALITKEEALLWTDSRYWNEANMQLDSSLWSLIKQGQPKVPTIVEYLSKKAGKEQEAATTNGHKAEVKPLRVGIDPYVFASSFADEFKEGMKKVAKEELDDESLEIGELVPCYDNLVDPIWEDERPPVPYNPFRVHPLEFAGVSVADKVSKIREEMETKKATMAVFCTLDDVAYLLNVRCMGDVDTCPVGIAYVTVTKDDVYLYCDERKVESADVQEHLSEVTMKPYESIVEDIKEHANEKDSNNKVWIDKSRSNLALVSVIPKKALINSQNAITPMKACKNEQELEGMRRAHIVDGAAMAKFIAWLEDKVVVQGESVSEVEIDEVLTAYRAEQPGFLECSFPTIAGVGSNAAIIHYSAKPGDLMKYLNTSEPILIDSGGQYTYGTTDVTRTWHFGTATDRFKEIFTRVLKGNIGVDTMIFPENTPGFVLDVMARQSLWEGELDYGHGTGHGVGAALNVHEGPMSISPRFGNLEGLKNGMVVSNEPGYYKDGAFGIRIENLLEMQYVNPEHNEPKEESETSAEKKYLKFAKLTLIPIQKNLIDLELMTTKELDWLDAYHEVVFEKVSPLLEAGSPAMKWLKKSCEKIDRGPN
ncbi:unnamed protein product [Pseudo-nitzschia multistriata]|uniref:Aminopeptidase P N-terminal domain-containing protein n=1 Tax=Pseudo-nitzschia multistriata TaxID=183589 RepID=A0A448ZCW7_9STRA|nr:unnamed protein product [Pseudo-nitzschia multistriata]